MRLGGHAIAKSKPSTAYEAHKIRTGQDQAAQSRAGRDIAPIPEVVDADRRAACESDFRLFCETYFPRTFTLAWSADHLRVIARIEDAVLRGGLFALAMPRKHGKTTLCERACIWAILYGHRRFVCLVGASKDDAVTMLDTITTELETNPRLSDDFPDVVYPFQRLEGIANRAGAQLCDGERTHISQTTEEIIVPMIPGSAASGAIVRVAGITGRIRGMHHLTPDGDTIRPDVAIVDDPQTDQSAVSLSQCRRRLEIVSHAILELAGPDVAISGIMPCTVIQPGDMADQVLNREDYPQWRGERTRALYSPPRAEKQWQKYADLLRSNPDDYDAAVGAAQAFYTKHQAEMDVGAEVAWPERCEPGYVSALEQLMRTKLLEPGVFAAEYQNEPLGVEPEETIRLPAEAIIAKCNSVPRGTVPAGHEHITAHVDVHQNVLFYAVAAWRDDFGGAAIDYGTYPDQRTPWFTLRNAKRTLAEAHPGTGVEGAIYAGLETLLGQLVAREWTREDGAVMRLNLTLIDQGWMPDVVHQFCRQSGHGGLVMPSRGQGIRASDRPLAEYDRRAGERFGWHWWVPAPKGKRILRHIEIDTNHWKTFIHQRLAVAMGDRGCLSLFGSNKARHQLLAEHLTAEAVVRTEARGRAVYEWKERPDKADNHWLDNLVGCAAAASYLGVAVPGVGETPGPRRKIKLSELQAQKRAERARGH